MQRPPGTHHPRPRRKIDWELVACGVRGHVLAGIDAAEVRPQDSILVREYGSVRWHRCLRCDGWVVLPASLPATLPHPPERDEIQLPLRGKALRDRVLLRVIAADRALHFVILVALGFAVLAVAGNEHSLRSSYYRFLTALQGGVGGGPVQSSGHVGVLHELDKLFTLRSGKLTEVGIGLLIYGLLEGVEAVGLWRARRWAEYLTFLATTILLPLEIYEIAHKQSPLKIVGFLINLAVVIYLLLAKRLFGLRGGGRADEEERMRDTSWEAVERATPHPPLPVAQAPA